MKQSLCHPPHDVVYSKTRPCSICFWCFALFCWFVTFSYICVVSYIWLTSCSACIRPYVFLFWGGASSPYAGTLDAHSPLFWPRKGGSVHIVSFVFLALTGSYAVWIANCYWFCVQVTTSECHRRVLYGSWAVWAQAHWSDILQIRQCGSDSQASGLVEMVLHLRPPRRGLGPCWDCAAWMLLMS